MPNVKLFIDQRLIAAKEAALAPLLHDLRALICARLDVPASACHLVILAVTGLPDQPPVNLELALLPRADRTPEALRALCAALRDTVTAVTGAPTAIRCAQLDPATYIALK